MRLGTVLLVVWLVIGAIAGGQRHYYTSSDPNCGRASTIAVTVLAGPLNYTGLNPKVSCTSKCKDPDSERPVVTPILGTVTTARSAGAGERRARVPGRRYPGVAGPRRC